MVQALALLHGYGKHTTQLYDLAALAQPAVGNGWASCTLIPRLEISSPGRPPDYPGESQRGGVRRVGDFHHDLGGGAGR